MKKVSGTKGRHTSAGPCCYVSLVLGPEDQENRGSLGRLAGSRGTLGSASGSGLSFGFRAVLRGQKELKQEGHQEH